ncbi:phosphoenolpyruvate--protein phosphotransferase [Nocardia callitridis]|uniref:Phosphocarrier protein HPr n=2 Tax=Nocardia callitridis TaxID=648753 RepID=A0ABP9K6C9_9NOCA
MIGIVAVSHSRSLATAAVGLAQEMLHGESVRIVVAAGLDEHTLGTDAVAVSEAIAHADSGDGVLVLMDLGSAVLSAELAIDLLESPHEVRLCAAPFVEGLIAAAVSAAGGADLDEAAIEAREALAGKQTHLGVPVAARPDAEGESAEESAVSGRFVVANTHGLHARPAARLVAEVRWLPASVYLRNLTTGTGRVSGKSLSRVAALGALCGHEICVEATGPGAADAVDRLLELAAQRFDETDDSTDSSAAGHHLPERGTGPYPASDGIGIGPVWRLGHAELVVTEAPSGPPELERALLDNAIDDVADDIERTRASAGAEADIFRAHLFLLEDDDLIDAVHRGILAGRSAAAAWNQVLESAAAELDRLTDEYQRARAADLRAVRDQVLAVLLGHGIDIVTRPGVLVSSDLTPAQAAGLDRDIVTGIVLAQGSPTSHSAILARSRGIPAVVGAGADILSVGEGTVIALDGGAGTVVVDPDPATLAEFTGLADAHRQRRRDAEANASEPAVTRDGLTVQVAANVGDVDTAAESVQGGADLAGLVRTEFLFLDRESAPSIDEQEQVYRAIAEQFAGRRIVLRTLDVGGDKPLPYVAQPEEANPFLGVRGIRLTLERRDLLRDQLTAIGRVAADHPVSVMFPMITQLDELLTARGVLDEVVAPEIALEVGIMVEVPATAAKTATFAEHVDFFSIGTNDLTQYALAAERGNDALNSLADPLDPGVLRLIAMVCEDAGSAHVAVCGEAAADPTAAAVLLGLGVDELSVSPPAIPLTKARVRELDLSQCRRIADEALRCADAEEVRALAAKTLE